MIWFPGSGSCFRSRYPPKCATRRTASPTLRRIQSVLEGVIAQEAELLVGEHQLRVAVGNLATEQRHHHDSPDDGVDRDRALQPVPKQQDRHRALRPDRRARGPVPPAQGTGSDDGPVVLPLPGRPGPLARTLFPLGDRTKSELRAGRAFFPAGFGTRRRTSTSIRPRGAAGRPPFRTTRGRTAPGSASSANGRSASFSPGGSRRRPRWDPSVETVDGERIGTAREVQVRPRPHDRTAARAHAARSARGWRRGASKRRAVVRRREGPGAQRPHRGPGRGPPPQLATPVFTVRARRFSRSWRPRPAVVPTHRKLAARRHVTAGRSQRDMGESRSVPRNRPQAAQDAPEHVDRGRARHTTR